MSEREPVPSLETGHTADIWIMKTVDGWYPITPSPVCKPEDHGELNPHVVSIEDLQGNVLWTRPTH